MGNNFHLLAVLSQGVFWNFGNDPELATLRLVIGHFAALQTQAAF